MAYGEYTRKETNSNINKSKRRFSSYLFRLNIFLLILSAACGVLCWWVYTNCYASFINNYPRPFVIGLFFFLIALTVCIVSTLITLIFKDFKPNSITSSRSVGEAFYKGVLAAIAVFMISSLLQFIYSIDYTEIKKQPTSLIFIVDDSGSMDLTDPNSLRYRSIQNVLSTIEDNIPFMVYGYADDVYIVRDLAQKSEGTFINSKGNGGMTSIKLALETTYNDLPKYRSTLGKKPLVILLTDGYATDFATIVDIYDLLENYKKSNVSISTIGVVDGDEYMLKEISDITGGRFAKVNDAIEISEAMGKVILSISDRDLLSPRQLDKIDSIYGVMRVIFLTLIGASIGFISMFVYGSENDNYHILKSSIVLSFIGALIIEYTGYIFAIENMILVLILFILMATKISFFKLKNMAKNDD